MRMLSWLFLTLCLLGAASAHADRDIVYAARYYYPPGVYRTSHFHLYRINPDGTYRIIWAAPLQVGAMGHQPKTITPGIVWVTGADWRTRNT